MVTRSLTAEAIYGTLGVVVMGWALFRLPADWYLPLLLIAGLILTVTPYSIRMSDPARLPAAMPIELLLMLAAPPQVSFCGGFRQSGNLDQLPQTVRPDTFQYRKFGSPQRSGCGFSHAGRRTVAPPPDDTK